MSLTRVRCDDRMLEVGCGTARGAAAGLVLPVDLCGFDRTMELMTRVAERVMVEVRPKRFAS